MAFKDNRHDVLAIFFGVAIVRHKLHFFRGLYSRLF